VRKVLGSLKGQLIRQFLAEALLIGHRYLLALLLVSLLMGPFNIVRQEPGVADLFPSWHLAFVLLLPSSPVAGRQLSRLLPDSFSSQWMY